jgi:23S rRNA pseudouridine1911/1915/1917 synthase
VSRDSTRSFVVGEGEAGLRLDAWLAAALGVSRAAARRELARGTVSVDGRRAGPTLKGRPLAAGTRIAVEAFAADAERAPVAEPETPLRVLAEGPGWVAVDKPAGMPVHPLLPGERGTVLNALVARRPEILGVGEGGLRCGVVHRLDVGTSGALLFATDDARFGQLREAFRRHRVAKTYRALVAGRLAGEGELALQLAVARHRPARVRVVGEDDPDFARRSRRTHLAWRALEALGRATLVEVQPVTGFLHQIRVSLAYLDHPVLGDGVYGAPDSAAPRPMLHAARVAHRDVEASAPDPPDFAALLAGLREARRAGGASARA